ncbi:hypothetical protein F5884DRAFT_767099 [Xylogone sp. PMI_703]|nr:hypothetical protein F5884DRAFT_767099 [Xylogone sp. PMI_703]
MDEWETPSPASSKKSGRSESASGSKQAACLNCRRSKTKCLRAAEDTKCMRCQKGDLSCVIPDFHIGRKKGIKNKRTGLDKAVYRIEQELRRTKRDAAHPGHEKAESHLEQLLREVDNLKAQDIESDNSGSKSYINSQSQPNSFDANYHQNPSQISINRDHTQSDQTGSFAFDDAENPLQLLARASDLSLPRNPLSSTSSSLLTSGHSASAPYTAKDETLRAFFGPFRPRLDVNEDIDPIEMGFITLEEADVLFTYFYQNLSHTRWGLDPLIHTVAFVRSRSAFLFTSVLAASALFIPSAAALHKRLSVHCKFLAHHVMSNRYRSPEIVLGFMVNVPWMSPGKHWADDETCSYMAMASTVAVDLSLNKLIVPPPAASYVTVPQNIPKYDCISARKALDLDGFDDVDPSSEWGQRLLRRRERIWLSLFVLDRGVCLARGRSSAIPVTPLIETCDNWHTSPMAGTWDVSIVSSAVMRRDLVTLIEDIKASCDGDRAKIANGSTLVKSLRDMIENFFNSWYAKWGFSVQGSKEHHLPPYVEILVCHTKLSTYSSVINHPTAPSEVSRYFRTAGLSSALNVLRAAVQGEPRLKSMPNNTAIMISFAACFAMGLSMMASGNNLSLAPSIRILVEEAADVLERIGSSPTHRKGASALYGKHLREVLKTAPLSNPSTQRRNTAVGSSDSQAIPNANLIQQPKFSPNTYVQGTPTSSAPMGTMGIVGTGPGTEPLLFSTMSDYQIVEAINNAGDELDTYMPDFHIDDRTGLDWLDWLDWFNMTGTTV